MKPESPGGSTLEKLADERTKKITVAAILTVQVTAMVLTLRYSKTPAPGQTTFVPYLSSTAVVLAEFLKMFICVVVLTFEHGTRILSHLWDELAKPKDMLLLSVPALLYLLQNNLLFFAMDNLDAALYQVTYQLKILTTALCTVLMLDRRLSVQQWVALVILTVGVALAQLQPASTNTEKSHQIEAQTKGIIALLFACFTSGFAGVYTEKLLKQTTATLWIRNIQLAIWSIVAGFIGIRFTKHDMDVIENTGFFTGYTNVVWVVVALQAGSGIVVALVMKLADNIVKNFSVSMSLLLSTIISVPLFGFMPSRYFALGSILVLYSVHLYSSQTPPAFLQSFLKKDQEA